MPAIEHAVSRKTLFESPWIALEASDIDYVPATTACFSPDGGRYCAVGTLDGRVLVWDFQTLHIVVRVLEKPSTPADDSSSSNEVGITNAGRVRCLAWGRGLLDGQWQLAVGYEASAVKALPESTSDIGHAAFNNASMSGGSRVPCGVAIGWGLAEGKQLWSHRFDATPLSIACRWQWGVLPSSGSNKDPFTSGTAKEELFGGGWFVAASDNQCWLVSGGAAGSSSKSTGEELIQGVSAEVLFRDPDLPPEGSLCVSHVDKARLETAAVSFRPVAPPSEQSASSAPLPGDANNDQPDVNGLLYIYVGHTVVLLGEEVEPGAAAAAAAVAVAEAAASEAELTTGALKPEREVAGEATDDSASKAHERGKDGAEHDGGDDDAADDDVSRSSTSSSQESGTAKLLLALGTAADAARAKVRAANVSNGAGFHLLRAERQPGHCSVSSLQVVDHVAPFPPRQHQEGVTTGAATATGGVKTDAATKEGAGQGAYPRWVVAVCSLSVRLLDAQSLRCVHDLGNSQRKSKTLGKASAVWAAAAVGFLPLAPGGVGDGSGGVGRSSLGGSGGMGSSVSSRSTSSVAVTPAHQAVLVASLVNGDRGPERDLEGQHHKYLCLWHLPVDGDDQNCANVVSVVPGAASSSLSSSFSFASDKTISTRGKRGLSASLSAGSAQMLPPPSQPSPQPSSQLSARRGPKSIERYDPATGEVWQVYQSGSSCARALGITPIEVSDTVHGKRSSAHGHFLRLKHEMCTNDGGTEAEASVGDAAEDEIEDEDDSMEVETFHEGDEVQMLKSSKPLAPMPSRHLAKGHKVRRKRDNAEGIVVRRNLAWTIVQFDEDAPGQTMNCRSGDLERIYEGDELEIEQEEIAREMEEQRAAAARDALVSARAGRGGEVYSQSGDGGADDDKNVLLGEDQEEASSRKRAKKNDDSSSSSSSTHASSPPPAPSYYSASMRAPVQQVLTGMPQLEMTLVAAPERRIRQLAFRCPSAGAAGLAGNQGRGDGLSNSNNGGGSLITAQPMLMALSDVGGGGAFALEGSRSTNWAGCMYPPGFEVLEDNLPYLEAEDELDVPVDASGQPLPWEDPEADFTEDNDVDVMTTTTTIVPSNAGGGGAQDALNNTSFELAEVLPRCAASTDATQSGTSAPAAATNKECSTLVFASPLCLEASAMRSHQKLTSTDLNVDDEDGSHDGTAAEGERPSRRNHALDELLAPRGFDDLLPAALGGAHSSSFSSSVAPPVRKTFPGKGRWWARVPIDN